MLARLGHRDFRHVQGLLGLSHCAARALDVAERSLGRSELSFLAGLQLRRVDAHQLLPFLYLVAGIHINLLNTAGHFARQLDVTNGSDFSGGRHCRAQFGTRINLNSGHFGFVFAGSQHADDDDQREHHDRRHSNN